MIGEKFMDLYEKIKMLRKQKKISQEKLAILTGYSDRSSITKIEQGKVDLSETKIKLFANALGTTPAYLLGWEQDTTSNSLSEKITTTVQQLNEENQNKTYQYAKNLLHFQNRTVQEVSIKYKSKELTEILVTEKVAAGVGYSYGNNEVTSFYTDREDLMQYDMATRVFGDSMEPELSDGDIILLKQGYDNVNGDIYVVDYDGKSYVKKLYNDGNRFVLKSINKKYSDIIIYTSDIQDTYFNIVGKVVDSFTPVEK